MAYHAKLSPSSADRWTSCTASINAQEGIPNTNSDASRQGTCCHQIQEECLISGADPQTYLGRVMEFWHDEDESGEAWAPLVTRTNITGTVKVTQEMVDAVTSAVNFVNQRVQLTGGILEVEQRMPIGHFTGEEGASGMSDVTLLIPQTKTLCIADSKFGRAKVSAYEILVPAHRDIITNQEVPEKVRGNLQMCCYALGALEKYKLFYEFEHVTMTIIQPMVNHVSEYSCTVAELLEVQEFLRTKATETREKPVFVPSADSCHFCRASGNCKAQTEAVIKTALSGFEDVDTAAPAPIKENALGSLYAAIPMIADWCKAVEARVYSDLQQNIPVVRNDGLAYKLVDGKKSARQWADAEEAEAKLIAMRIPRDAIYEKVFISPTTAEKLAAVKKPKKGQPAPPPPVIGPTQWARIQTLITQGQGKPAVALQTDPRPAIAQAATGFEDVPDAVQNSDLF